MGHFKLTYRNLRDLCSSKNSFLHTRSYATASISPAEKEKYLLRPLPSRVLVGFPSFGVLPVRWLKCQKILKSYVTTLIHKCHMCPPRIFQIFDKIT